MTSGRQGWTASEVHQLRRLWAEGVPAREIGGRIGGRAAKAVSAKASCLGLPRRGGGGGRKVDEAGERRLREMWMAGASQSEIARAIGIVDTSLWQIAARLGLPRRIGHGRGAVPVTRLAEIDRARFAALWRAGVAEGEIAMAFGINLAAVRVLCDDLGLVARPGRSRARPKPAPAPAVVAVVPEAAPAVPAMPPHPFWTPERDAAVVGTGGAWTEIAALAIRLGRPVAAVAQRWHRLRVAA